MAKAKKMAVVADRCDNGLTEITDQPVLIPRGSVARLNIEICGSPANIVVVLGGKVLYNQKIDDSFSGSVSPPLDPSGDLMVWTVLPSAETWRVQTEVDVLSAVQFRMRKSTTSKFPLTKFSAWVRGV